MSVFVYLDGGEGKAEARFDGSDVESCGFLRIFIAGTTVSIDKMDAESIEYLGLQILNAAEAAREHEAKKSMLRVLIAEA